MVEDRILLVGQSAQLLNSLKNAFPQLTVFTVADMQQTFDFILRQDVEIMLLLVDDNFIEAMTLVGKIRSLPDYSNTPLLIVDKSPFAIPDNLKLAFQSGASDYLSDAAQEKELLARIELHLKNARRMAELSENNRNLSQTLGIMDKLVLFIDRADNSFVIFDRHGEMEWVNEGFKRLYGYQIDEFKRKFGRTIFDASKNSEIVKKVNQCVESKKSVNYVAECQIRSGEFKWIQTTLTPIIDADGAVERFIAIETDITKLKETEEALNQKNEYMLALTNHLKSANTLLEEQQKEINVQNKQIESERKKSDDLLLNILPFEVARQLKSKGEARPRSYKLASVLFLDFVNFSDITRELSPKDLIHVLDSYFKAFDDIVEKHFIEKIKTIGDAYMCVGGLPLSNKSNPFNCVLAAFEMQNYVKSKMDETRTPNGLEWKCKTGISTGELIAGVVGKKKYIYDVWGNTVNIAARMQEQGQDGRINVSEYTYHYIKDYFECSSRGMVATKRGYNLKMYYVDRIKPDYSADADGFFPNDEFLKMINAL
jgi:PAS domain S-box-containing protein